MGYRRAEQKKLARILSGMKGIETASVQYAEIKKPGFPPTCDIRAVVAVRADGRRQLNYEEIEAIRDTMAGYVAGLERAQVTVSDLNACRAYPGGGDAADPAAANYAARAEQSRLEEDFRAKIQSRLTAYPGAIVGVNVQLTEASESPAAGPVAARRRLVPALVSASIDLPKSYFAQVWREQNANAESSAHDRQAVLAVERDVKQTVEQAVLALLPLPVAEMRGSPQVVVTSYEDLPLPGAPATAAWRAGARAWTAEHQVLILAASVLTAGALLLVRQRLSSAARRAARPKASRGAGHDATPAACDTASAGAEPRIQVEISRAIQENPEAAVEKLQRWLSKAA
jgi:flagellar biosynthesis/type III secretory pathway M-ring protein FliF/YscJ